MAHFAQLDQNNIVQQVIVVDNQNAPTEKAGIEYIKDVLKLDGVWLQTSYNGNIRGKFAGVNDIYDVKKDEFIKDFTIEEQLKTARLEQKKQIESAIAQKEAIAAKIGLTVEELQVILKG